MEYQNKIIEKLEKERYELYELLFNCKKWQFIQKEKINDLIKKYDYLIYNQYLKLENTINQELDFRRKLKSSIYKNVITK